MHTVPGERVQVRRQRGDERLALTGLHLGDPPEVQRGAAHDLDVEVALTEDPLAGLADGREGLGEEVVEVLDPLLPVRADGVEARPELGGERAQLVVGAALHLRLERGDLRNDRLEHLELLGPRPRGGSC